MDQQIMMKAILFFAFTGVSLFAQEGVSFQALESRKQPEKIQALSKKLAIVQRKTGPFGLFEDLTVQKITKTQKRVAASNEFPEAIAKISINVVLGKSFLIGSREIKESETFPLVYKGNRFNIRVISVRANQITFKNMETGEQVIKKMGVMPEGFTKDTGKEKFPGVVPSGKSNPIEVKE